MRVSLFDYRLPPEHIAQEPLEPRDASRLLVLHRDRADAGSIEHRSFGDLAEYIHPGDCLVLNETRVIPARIFASREPSGGRVEILLLERADGDQNGDGSLWEALVKPGRKVHPGDMLRACGTTIMVEDRLPNGGRLLRFPPGGAEQCLSEGEIPLPPYIKSPIADPERYQTIYARDGVSAAAPTAGLHFTPALLADLGRKAQLAKLTLDIGLDTFRPVKTEEVEEHSIHTEKFAIPSDSAQTINRARAAGGRVLAIGTTAARALETAADNTGEIQAGSGRTGLFIYPGYRLQAVDMLLTNFHLPKSTLLMLVCAFAGRERVLAAYEEAIREGYRFYSFGDAMLIL